MFGGGALLSLQRTRAWRMSSCEPSMPSLASCARRDRTKPKRCSVCCTRSVLSATRHRALRNQLRCCVSALRRCCSSARVPSTSSASLSEITSFCWAGISARRGAAGPGGMPRSSS
eukprot:15290714-Alexandrium_andersonii.AAC.1